MISYNNFALYNPVQKALLFGGGSSVYKMASNGTITKMRAPPVSLCVTSAVLSVDPVSGKHIVLTDSAAYQYELRAGWTVQPNFQFIVRPGGGATNPLSALSGRALKNAEVFVLRKVLKF